MTETVMEAIEKVDDVPAGPMMVCGEPKSAQDETSTAGTHTLPIEQDGLSMADLIAAMKKDADLQKHLVTCCAELVEDTVKYNDENKKECELTAFEGEPAPIEPSAFVRRILKYGGCSPCCIVIGFLYLERLKRIFRSVCLTSKNFQRLLLIAIMEAAKFLDDSYYSNKRWAEVGGITTKELNRLELEFLFRIGFSLSLTREEYDWYVRSVIDPPPAEATEGEKGLSKTGSFQDVAQAAQHFSVPVQ